MPTSYPPRSQTRDLGHPVLVEELTFHSRDLGTRRLAGFCGLPIHGAKCAPWMGQPRVVVVRILLEAWVGHPAGFASWDVGTRRLAGFCGLPTHGAKCAPWMGQPWVVVVRISREAWVGHPATRHPHLGGDRSRRPWWDKDEGFSDRVGFLATRHRIHIRKPPVESCAIPGAQKRGTWGNHPLRENSLSSPGTWASLPVKRMGQAVHSEAGFGDVWLYFRTITSRPTAALRGGRRAWSWPSCCLRTAPCRGSR